ncbi:MAG: NAD(P)H-dependent oxidoreductase [Marmoricola sp.]
MSVAVLVGNPKPQSRTREAALCVARELYGGAPDFDIDLADLGPALLDPSSDWVDAAVEQVSQSRLLVVASPTYKGTYTGLLKLFLDRIGAGALSDVTAVPLMLGADLRHALAVETFLKPVLNELGASTPTSGLFLLDSTWHAPNALDAWLKTARHQLGGVLA